MIVDDETSNTMSARATGGYDLCVIGGNVSEILRIHRARPVWDQEMLDEIIFFGGKPPLLRVLGVRELANYKTVDCELVQPSGAPLRTSLPLALMNYFYPEDVKHLV